MRKLLRALLRKHEESQLQRAQRIDFSGKPFTKALCLRAAKLQDDAIQDLRLMGAAHRVRGDDSMAELARSAAITIAYEVTTRASESANKPYVFMPTEAIPRTADMTVAFGLFILTGIYYPLRREGIDLSFADAAAAMSLMFYTGFAKRECILRTQRAIAAFQSVSRADQSNVAEWRENCFQLVGLYVHQWTTANEQLKQQDLIPLFASLLISLLRSVE